MKNCCCDIIVPIYNAYDETIKCIESVIKNTVEPYRLILINDKSSDTRIEEWLEGLATEGSSNIVIMNNDFNLGFVKTVNKGIRYSRNDVVILNSDTLVTEGWLGKLKDCAYSNDNIATVTPLTNNGSICSVPRMGETNAIPKGFTLQEYGLIVEKISFRKYPSIPTGVGFCIFIKRRILDILGVFDEDCFNKGYGEEVDFCLKASENGFINVLCDDTFVYHKGGMSFKNLRDKYLRDNAKILDKRYPYYLPMVSRFTKQNPLKDIQKNIELYIKLKNNKRNILHVLSRDMNSTYESNAILKLPRALNENSSFNNFLFYSNGQELMVTAYIDSEVLNFRFDIGEEITYTTFHSRRYAEIFESIIRGFDIDLVHIHNLKGHTFDIMGLAEKSGIPQMITLYDLSLICPDLRICDLGDAFEENGITIQECCEYVKRKLGYTNSFVEAWKRKVEENLAKFKWINTFSESIKVVIEKYYSSIKLMDVETISPELESGAAFDSCCMDGMMLRAIAEGFFENEYDRLIHTCQVKSFSSDSYNFIFEGYKKYLLQKPYRDIFLAVSREISDKEWDMHIENIRCKVPIDKELMTYMRFGLSYAKNKFRDKSIDYIIWGAGSSGINTKAIIEEILPGFRLIGYIDKYKEGSIGNVNIYKPEDMIRLKFDYIILASSTGKEEVAGILDKQGLSMLNDYIAGYGVVLTDIFYV